MKIKLLVLLLLVSGNVSFAIPKSEKKALIDLYHNTNGNEWINSWDLSSSVSTWKGVLIEDNHVVSITLFNNNLQGSLPVTIGNFENLQVLNLAFNN